MNESSLTPPCSSRLIFPIHKSADIFITFKASQERAIESDEATITRSNSLRFEFQRPSDWPPSHPNSSSLYSFTVLLIRKSNYVTPPTTSYLKTFKACPSVLRIWCLLILLAIAFLTPFFKLFKLFTVWKMPHFLSLLGLHTYLEYSAWNSLSIIYPIPPSISS